MLLSVWPGHKQELLIQEFLIHHVKYICKQDYAKIIESICIKHGGGMGNGPGKNPLNFGADLDHVL